MATYDLFPGLTNIKTPRPAARDWSKKYLKRDAIQAFYFDVDVAQLIADGIVPATGLVANDIVQLARVPVGIQVLGGRLAWSGWGADDPTAVTCNIRLYVPGTVINNPGDLTGSVNLMAGSGGDLAANISLKYGMRVGIKDHVDDPHDAGYLGQPAALSLRMVTVTTSGDGCTVGRARGHILAMGSAT